jgi:hypothetical protein
VTTITGAALAKPQLLRWAAKQVALWAADNAHQLDAFGRDDFVKLATDAPNRERDSRAARGTELHKHAEQLVTIGHTDAPAEQVPLVEACAGFLDDWEAVPVLSERIVYHDTNQYAGRLDLVADLSDGKRWLLDFKTGAGVYPDMALQLAGYRYARMVGGDDSDETMPTVDAVGVVHVREDGARLYPLVVNEDTYAVFMACRLVYEFTRARDIVGAPAVVPG